MWKDFFYFSKSERRAILFLLTLLFIFMCIWVLFPVKEESLEQDQEGDRRNKKLSGRST